MGKKPIVIMAAMEIESNFLLKQLQNTQCETVNKYKFYKGTINEYPVIICKMHGMSINAAVATYIAIDKYNPIAIISQGTAGAHAKNIHKGDIVIGKNCLNIVSCQTPHKKEGEGSDSLEWNLLNFTCNENNTLEYQHGNESLIELCKRIDYHDGNVHFGTLGSGDIWNNETDKILCLHNKYRTLCEDMESISIYTIANEFHIPVIGIRIISNNEILGEGYDRNTGILSQKFTYNLILEIIKINKK